MEQPKSDNRQYRHLVADKRFSGGADVHHFSIAHFCRDAPFCAFLVEALPDFVETLMNGHVVNHPLTMFQAKCSSVVTGECDHDEEQQ